MTSMNTRLNIKKLDGNIIQKHGGSKQVGLKQLSSKQVRFKQLGHKQVGFKQLGPGVERGFHVSNDDTTVAQRRLKEKQPEEKTNTECLVKEHERYESRLDEKASVASVADMIYNNNWLWPNRWTSDLRCISNIMIPDLKEGVNDYVLWKDNNGIKGSFSIKKVWNKFKDVNPEVNWYKVVGFSQCNPRFAFIMWRAMHKRLATQDRIMIWNKNNQLLCPLCKTVNDSHDHRFFKCSYSKEGSLEKSQR
ncbi:zinc finger, CCHC-type containing protein [Tanacetum coccineum]